MKKTEMTPEELRQVQALQQSKNAQMLKRFILDKTEARVKDKTSDESLDQEILKRKILDTIEDKWKLKNLDAKVLKTPAEYEPIFTQEYYKEMFRLKGWEYQGVIAEKPWMAGRHTNEIIYFRFSQEVLPFLRIVNPFIMPGIRKYKHHQYLTQGERELLKQFIEEATECMRGHADWNCFRIDYCKKYNVPYQLKFSL
ncbi:hypothetical protein EAX61_06900 [Dokdonia sinensis]|jgi:hypothetical protein|uniref:Bacteriophage Mx8 p63 C-terminal domain-containing protein n=1 Tax=Dokdonia sinensis TaxID=2479847 RepID=A0A3M0G6N5_9FLAO|nr:P63C domain-containing protein [Dokdonia sinensis]RMB60544.1 hypothetical protein EAX61_06900 [Dokdonia sinensis]